MASKPYPDARRGTWRMKYRPRPGGPWVTVTLGHDPRLKSSRPPEKPPADLDARAKEFADIEYRAAHGLVAATPRARPLAEYAERYKAAYVEDHDEGSLVLLRRYLDDFVAWSIRRGVTTVQAVNKAHCKDYIDHRKRDLAGTTLRTMRSYISGLFARAVDEELIVGNPWYLARVGKGVRQKKKARFWTSEEVGRIVAACEQRWHKDIVLLLAHTGIRASAALAMRWDWIDWGEATIRVPAEHNKGGHEYEIYMSDLIHDVLFRLHAASKHDHAFVNPKTGRPYSYHAAYESIVRAIAKARVPKGTPHDLRHTFGRWLHLAGVPQSLISSQLGHASIATTEIYTKMAPGDAIKVMRRLTIGIGLAEGAPPGTAPRPASDDASGRSG